MSSSKEIWAENLRVIAMAVQSNPKKFKDLAKLPSFSHHVPFERWLETCCAGVDPEATRHSKLLVKEVERVGQRSGKLVRGLNSP